MTFYQCTGSGSTTLLLRVLLPAGVVSDSNHMICRPSNYSIDAGGGRDQRLREPGVRDRVQPGLHRQLPDVPHPPRVQDSLVAEGTYNTHRVPALPPPLTSSACIDGR
jgi:hypothetical protein